MARNLSAATVRELFKQSSGEAYHTLLTISHADMSTVRLCDDAQDIVSRGDTYVAFGFQITLPPDVSEQLPRAQLQIPNVDRRLIDELRSIEGPLLVTMEVVTATDPDTVEVGPYAFDLVDVTYTAKVVSGTLAYEPILEQTFPADTFTPQLFPRLFKR